MTNNFFEKPRPYHDKLPITYDWVGVVRVGLHDFIVKPTPENHKIVQSFFELISGNHVRQFYHEESPEVLIRSDVPVPLQVDIKQAWTTGLSEAVLMETCDNLAEERQMLERSREETIDDTLPDDQGNWPGDA